MFSGLGYSCHHLPEYSRLGLLGSWCNIVPYCDNTRRYDLDGVRIMSALYKLTDELTAAERDLSEMLGNEVISEQEYGDTLAAIYSECQIKESSVIAYVKNLKADQAMFKAESEKLLKKAKSAAKKAESLECYLLGQMIKTGQSESGEGVHTAKIKKGSKRCLITGDVDDKWLVTKTTSAPDKAAITRAIKAGETIEGAALVAGPDTLKIN